MISGGTFVIFTFQTYYAEFTLAINVAWDFKSLEAILLLFFGVVEGLEIQNSSCRRR